MSRFPPSQRQRVDNAFRWTRDGMVLRGVSDNSGKRATLFMYDDGKFDVILTYGSGHKINSPYFRTLQAAKSWANRL